MQPAKASLPASRGRAEVERVRATLRTLVDLSGMSRREVRRRLAAAGSGMNLAGLLSGRLDLKLRHVVDLGRVLGVEPGEFFRLVFGAGEAGQRSPLLRRLEGLIAPGRRQAAERGAAAGREELEALSLRVEKLAGRVEDLLAGWPCDGSLPSLRISQISRAARSRSRPAGARRSSAIRGRDGQGPAG
jgi:hypothetical protein